MNSDKKIKLEQEETSKERSRNMKVKHKMLLNRKDKRGITLIALVITIIVLLILAGVTISLTLGENGLLKRAEESKIAHEQGAKNDTEFMNSAYEYMNPYFNGSTGGNGGTTPGEGGDEPETPTPPFTSNLTDEEKTALEIAGIAEMQPSEITNDNLKDNENIKGVITGEVPIPTGASYKEGKKDTGVVVTMGESEFVWVPVSDISEMAVLQEGSTENYQGVLYDFEGTTATKKTIATIGGGSGYREPDVLTGSSGTSYDGSTSNLAKINNILGTAYTTADQFQTALQSDFNSMVVSVVKYKGFFIGRYETSLDAEKKAQSKAGVLPATEDTDSANTWYGSYAYHKKMAEANGYTSVESHMIWRKQL